MLRLTSVTKDYKVADTSVRALNEISLSFRKNEFVSVLGPSGCGKTTLLNIIGGLDKYTSGDVSINGVSTKRFRDSDWDVYRNHRVGFIFQSYNLIPHQTVLGNVELALTIAGVGSKERTERAKKALDRVGLKGQYNKKPNQLSGGKCQRVAIARALVNEPEILLADEPTGALDTTTSVQIMELIKEIAREKLVIMVTHNPALAEQYSTRIIRLLDGVVVDDTMPYSAEEEMAEERVDYVADEKAADKDKADSDSTSAKKTNAAKKTGKTKRAREKAKMSPFTAFRLSAQNLFTKKARTIMTSVAGAIGIIGVSLVLAMSFGVRTYINSMQNDMLSGNPIMVQETAFDMSALLQVTSTGDKLEIIQEAGYVNVNSMIENLIAKSKTAESLMINNTITQDYVDYVSALPEEDAAAVFLDYGLDVSNNIYTDFSLKARPSEENADTNTKTMSLSAIRTQYIAILKKTMFKQYATYVTTVVDNFAQCPADESYVLEQYDLKSGRIAKEKDEVMVVLDGDSMLTDIVLAQLGYYSQDEFMNLIYRGAKETDPSMEELYDPALDKDRFSYEEILGKTFTYYPNDDVYNVQKTSSGENVSYSLTYNHLEGEWDDGLPLKVVGILQPKETISYGCMTSGFYYTSALTDYILEQNAQSEIVKYFDDTDKPYEESGWSVDKDKIPYAKGITYIFSYTYLNENNEETVFTDTGFVGNPNDMSAIMGIFSGGSGDTSAEMYFLTKQQVGGINVANGISVYPHDFTTKENVLKYLDRWNSDEDIVVNGKTIASADREDIVYTDNLSVIIDMINQFIDIVTIALVGFTALSLVVSSVMIAIITYVSVVERTKEIGVIRSLGGRKKDVSRLFTAETAIIGLASGLIGIAITYLCTLIINLVVSSLTVVSRIAILPWYQAAIMVGVSVLLTLVSGVFPARAAAKKDPVVALRTE
mgnify:FL=1